VPFGRAFRQYRISSCRTVLGKWSHGSVEEVSDAFADPGAAQALAVKLPPRQ
jgi:hypothetical protein